MESELCTFDFKNAVGERERLIYSMDQTAELSNSALAYFRLASLAEDPERIREYYYRGAADAITLADSYFLINRRKSSEYRDVFENALHNEDISQEDAKQRVIDLINLSIIFETDKYRSKRMDGSDRRDRIVECINSENTRGWYALFAVIFTISSIVLIGLREYLQFSQRKA